MTDLARLRRASLLARRLLLLLSVVAVGCGGAPPGHVPPARPHDLGEARALEVIAETLQHEGIAAGPGWEVDVGGAERMRVDVRLGGGTFGVEYVTRQDREDVAELPPAPTTLELQILPGAGEDTRAQVLLLDERAYRFYPGVADAQDGRRSAHHAEGRLGRDVADFVAYVRGQGGP